MTDKNGKEIKAGQVVLITGAFYKNDNGLWLVTNVPGAPDWHGKDVSLARISKSGKLGTAKGRCGFWPLMSLTNSRAKNIEATAWNAEHASIEVLDSGAIKSWAAVKELFQNEANGNREFAKVAELEYGWNMEEVYRLKEMAAYQQGIADGIPA